MKAVNLLPSDHKGAPKAPSPAKLSAPTGSAFGAYAVLGLLAMAVVAVAAMVLTNNAISDKEAELARVKAEAQVVAAKANALKPYADFKQLADARVQTVQSLATSRFDWEQSLRDLSRALPRDVRLSSLKGTAGTTVGGTASPSIDLSGCTGSQTKVAKLMARLRAVRGVTRVALRSSAKAGSVGGGGGSELCGPGNKPSFTLGIYFERFGVPALNLPSGAAAGAGAAGATGPTGPTGPAPAGAPTAQAASTTPPATNSNTQGVSAP